MNNNVRYVNLDNNAGKNLEFLNLGNILGDRNRDYNLGKNPRFENLGKNLEYGNLCFNLGRNLG